MVLSHTRELAFEHFDKMLLEVSWKEATELCSLYTTYSKRFSISHSFILGCSCLKADKLQEFERIKGIMVYSLLMVGIYGPGSTLPALHHAASAYTTLPRLCVTALAYTTLLWSSLLCSGLHYTAPAYTTLLWPTPLCPGATPRCPGSTPRCLGLHYSAPALHHAALSLHHSASSL